VEEEGRGVGPVYSLLPWMGVKEMRIAVELAGEWWCLLCLKEIQDEHGSSCFEKKDVVFPTLEELYQHLQGWHDLFRESTRKEIVLGL